MGFMVRSPVRCGAGESYPGSVAAPSAPASARLGGTLADVEAPAMPGRESGAGMTEAEQGERAPNAESRRTHLQQTRVMLRPTGNPLPLAFMALAIATVGFSALQLGIVAPAEEHVIALAVLVLTVPLQLLSSVIGFGARDSIAGTGMAMVSGVWAMIAVSTLLSEPGSSSPALGILLQVAALALLVPVSASRGKVLASMVLVGSAVRFSVTGISHLSSAPAWEVAAGILGMLLGALALYAALGFELEESAHPVQLPLTRRKAGLEPFRDSLEEQVDQIASEAGVRRQL